MASKYHHGDLRRALLDAAVTSVAADGPSALSLRALATAAGVSHAAPLHHFKDKAGLFTAVATEGFDLLDQELTTVWRDTGDFLQTGIRYVHFALAHKGHFEVMFRPELLNNDDAELVDAKERAFALLQDPVAAGRHGAQAGVTAEAIRPAALASWSTVHGLATLLLSGNLPGVDLSDPDGTDDLARLVLLHLSVV
jgi:AcrR family transcriptional regulator